MHLCEVAADFAISVLKPGGHFLAKTFQGGTEMDLLARLKQNFRSSSTSSRRPRATSWSSFTCWRGNSRGRTRHRLNPSDGCSWRRVAHRPTASHFGSGRIVRTTAWPVARDRHAGIGGHASGTRTIAKHDQARDDPERPCEDPAASARRHAARSGSRGCRRQPPRRARQRSAGIRTRSLSPGWPADPGCRQTPGRWWR